MACINRHIAKKQKRRLTKPEVKMLSFSILFGIAMFVSSFVELKASRINGGFWDFETDIFFCENSRKEQIFKKKDMQDLYVLKFLTLIIPVPEEDLPDETFPKEDETAVYLNEMFCHAFLWNGQNTEMEANMQSSVCCGSPHMPSPTGTRRRLRTARGVQ